MFRQKNDFLQGKTVYSPMPYRKLTTLWHKSIITETDSSYLPVPLVSDDLKYRFEHFWACNNHSPFGISRKALEFELVCKFRKYDCLALYSREPFPNNQHHQKYPNQEKSIVRPG